MLLLSLDKPNLESYCRQFGYETDKGETRQYDAFLESLKEEDYWRFRITVNPVQSAINPIKGRRGKVRTLITPTDQKKWLIQQAKKYGFSLENRDKLSKDPFEDDLFDDEPMSQYYFEIVQKIWFDFYKKGHNKVSLLAVTYEGILKITDVKLFKESLINGIGREKAYGCGLMTIMPF